MRNAIRQIAAFFSNANTWLGNEKAQGNCWAAQSRHMNATVVRMAGARREALRRRAESEGIEVTEALLASLRA